MPWTARDAESFTHHADTKEKREIWAQIANKQLEDSDGDDKKAIRIANYAVRRIGKKKKDTKE